MNRRRFPKLGAVLDCLPPFAAMPKASPQLQPGLVLGFGSRRNVSLVLLHDDKPIEVFSQQITCAIGLDDAAKITELLRNFTQEFCENEGLYIQLRVCAQIVGPTLRHRHHHSLCRAKKRFPPKRGS
jgi:hypothetical protein